MIDALNPSVAAGDAAVVLLNRAQVDGALIICEAVYAELAAHFASAPELDGFLTDGRIRLAPSSREALVRTGFAWRTFTRGRKRNALACAACGKQSTIACPQCGRPLSSRQHVLADFLIGGHASVHADRLLTTDRGYYHTHFPKLKLASA